MAGGYLQHCRMLMVALIMLILFVGALPSSSSTSITRRYHFNIEWKNVTRLCHNKPLLTVNGKYPGPTVYVREGDNVEIKVTNRDATNTTIHWHGIKQIRNGWADGPAYITQCPIAQGQTYTYKFKVVDQRGTLWWHTHHMWQRATVHGALIIKPRMPYPFSVPIQAEIPIVLGEWWNDDIDAVERRMMHYGSLSNISDAYTINGLPGLLYPCSTRDTFIHKVDPGKTYMLRIINAAMNNELFFSIANHALTVVEIDAVYTKPFTTKSIMIGPGQTTNVLFTTSQVPDPSGLIEISVTPYITVIIPWDNSTAVGFFHYNTQSPPKYEPLSLPYQPKLYNLPANKDIGFVAQYSHNLRSLASTKYPCNVPKTIEKRVVTTIGLSLQDCPPNKTCLGFFNKSHFASMNNQSFVRPLKSILECVYYNLTNCTYSTDFSKKPPHAFNYTGVNPFTENMNTEFGSRVIKVPYGTNLEIVLQDTAFLNVMSHPIHVHGHNFFIVGMGFGNFNLSKDPLHYNLVDPPERNTVNVPIGGWAAIRLKADNPGAWFIHCHLEQHTSWGLATSLIVENGPHPSQRVKPPPKDLPRC